MFYFPQWNLYQKQNPRSWYLHSTSVHSMYYIQYDSYSVVKLQWKCFSDQGEQLLIEFPKALERKAFHLGSRNTSIAACPLAAYALPCIGQNAFSLVTVRLNCFWIELLIWCLRVTQHSNFIVQLIIIIHQLKRETFFCK